VKKLLILAALLLFALCLVPGAIAQDDGYTIAFVPGVNPDPFYITMSGGVYQAAEDLGLTVIQQDPERFDVTVSAPIIEALIARGDIDALVTAPNDKEQSIPVLQAAHDAGIVVLLCSSRVGGEGLTLTEANHVIFLNEWWNPSANAQARDRVVRLGQERIVHVHRFRCRNTVEHVLDYILEEKERTFTSIVDALAKEVRLGGVDVGALLNDALENADASLEE